MFTATLEYKRRRIKTNVYLCGHGVGDEPHFLFVCSALDDLRAVFLNNVPLNLNSAYNITYLPNIAMFTYYGFRRLFSIVV